MFKVLPESEHIVSFVLGTGQTLASSYQSWTLPCPKVLALSEYLPAFLPFPIFYPLSGFPFDSSSQVDLISQCVLGTLHPLLPLNQKNWRKKDEAVQRK